MMKGEVLANLGYNHTTPSSIHCKINKKWPLFQHWRGEKQEPKSRNLEIDFRYEDTIKLSTSYRFQGIVYTFIKETNNETVI